MEVLLAGTDAEISRTVLAVWEEYAASTTPEARLVHQLDKLEAYLQGREYALDGRLADASTLNSFRRDVTRAVGEALPAAILTALEGWSTADPSGDASTQE